MKKFFKYLAVSWLVIVLLGFVSVLVLAMIHCPYVVLIVVGWLATMVSVIYLTKD